jgi:hypothetical protein
MMKNKKIALLASILMVTLVVGVYAVILSNRVTTSWTLRESGTNLELYWVTFECTEETTVSIPATITVEELVNEVKWTIDMDEVTGPFGNGHAAVALVIGVGNDIKYQIHSNDGTCAAYDWGTWLYSPYDKTGGGYYGWHTSEEAWNTKVDDLWWVHATGDRYLVGNPTLEFTITINNNKLGTGIFKWAMQLMGDTSDTYTPSDFSWADEDTTNFHTATVGRPTGDLHRGEWIYAYIGLRNNGEATYTVIDRFTISAPGHGLPEGCITIQYYNGGWLDMTNVITGWSSDTLHGYFGPVGGFECIPGYNEQTLFRIMFDGDAPIDVGYTFEAWVEEA